MVSAPPLLSQVDGDILILIKNLRYFKEFMALGRQEANP